MGTRSSSAPEPSVKAIVVDPSSLTVLWLNAPAARVPGAEPLAAGAALERAMPVAERLGATQAVRDTAADGTSRHLATDLVSTARGALSIVVSVHRLPDGTVLLLEENVWQAERRGSRGADSGEGRRR